MYSIENVNIAVLFPVFVTVTGKNLTSAWGTAFTYASLLCPYSEIQLKCVQVTNYTDDMLTSKATNLSVLRYLFRGQTSRFGLSLNLELNA